MVAPGIGPARKMMVRPALYAPAYERTVAVARSGFSPREARLAGVSALTLAVHSDIFAIQQAWQGFETRAMGTLYQNFIWCRAWLETSGAELGATPMIVTARDAAGQLRFLLPLQIRRRQGMRVLEWLGFPHHNYGYGLYDAAFLAGAGEWFEAHWASVVEAVGKVDAIALTQMPDTLFGRPNPMAPIFNIRGANLSFSLHLQPDFEIVYNTKFSSERRRTARKNEAHLAKTGEIEFGLPVGKDRTHEVIDVMFRQQEQRLAEMGVHGVFGPSERRFIHRIAELQDEDHPILAPYYLSSGGEILSVMLGGIHANGYWALISSLAAGPRRRYSPGDLALRRTIAACGKAGLAFFDFSAGDAPYKRHWADETLELYHTLQACSLKGLVWSSAMSLLYLAKRVIKRNPALKAVVLSARRRLFGTAPA